MAFGHNVACWLCSGRGERQFALKPSGVPDGRRICRVCTRRLLECVGTASRAGEDLSPFGDVWVLELAPIAPDESWRADLRRAFVENVASRLPAADEAARAKAALAYFGMGMVAEGLATAATIDPSVIEAETLSERQLSSLLWRMLDEQLLQPGARERLKSLLYAPA